MSSRSGWAACDSADVVAGATVSVNPEAGGTYTLAFARRLAVWAVVTIRVLPGSPGALTGSIGLAGRGRCADGACDRGAA